VRALKGKKLIEKRVYPIQLIAKVKGFMPSSYFHLNGLKMQGNTKKRKLQMRELKKLIKFFFCPAAIFHNRQKNKATRKQ
jgi:hypothetical protein